MLPLLESCFGKALFLCLSGQYLPYICDEVMAVINAVWLVLLAGGVVCAMVTNNGATITVSALDGAQTAVELSIKLVGVMCLWLGMMRIAEKARIIFFMARFLRPIMKRIFPSVPADHPALGSIVMTVSANMFGMGNAATPFGIKAMKDLQSLSDDKMRATPAMCTFIALCAAGVNLIPTTIIALRSAAGSLMPGQTIAVTIAVSFVTMVCVLILDRICRSISYHKGG